MNKTMKTLQEAVDAYLAHLRLKNYSAKTVETRAYNFGKLLEWLEIRSIANIADVDANHLYSYQKHLYRVRKANGKPLQVSSQIAHLSAAKQLFMWLQKQGAILANPAIHIELPKMPKRLPRRGLNKQELKRLRALPNLNSKLGYRDRTMIELLLASGIRRAELCKLCIEDIDFEQQTLFIRLGKGQKDRMALFGKEAAKWLSSYLADIRPELENLKSGRAVFLSFRGSPLDPETLGQHMKGLFRKTKIEKEGACHLLRHTFAVHMLENGADSRIIQELLGHESLETTARYTQLDVRRLKKVYDACF